MSLYSTTGCGRITVRPVTCGPSGTEGIAEAPDLRRASIHVSKARPIALVKAIGFADRPAAG